MCMYVIFVKKYMGISLILKGTCAQHMEVARVFPFFAIFVKKNITVTVNLRLINSERMEKASYHINALLVKKSNSITVL